MCEASAVPPTFLWLQTSDSDEHAVLDRDPPERSSPVARQGSHADGLASYSLQQHVIGSTPRLRTLARTTHRAPAAVSHSPRDVSQAPPSAFSTYRHTHVDWNCFWWLSHAYAGAAPLTAVQPNTGVPVANYTRNNCIGPFGGHEIMFHFMISRCVFCV